MRRARCGGPGFGGRRWGAGCGRGSRRGATITELMLWTIAAGLIAAVVIGAFNAVTASLDRNEAVRGLSTLRAKIESIYAGQSTYAGLTDTRLDRRGAIPDGWRELENVAENTTCTGESDTSDAKACARIRHPFDGRVTVAPDGGRFWIGFHGLDNAECSALLDVYVGRSRSRGGLAAAHVAGSAVSNIASATPDLADPTFDMHDVETECNNGDDSNFVYFQFG